MFLTAQIMTSRHPPAASLAKEMPLGSLGQQPMPATRGVSENCNFSGNTTEVAKKCFLPGSCGSHFFACGHIGPKKIAWLPL